MIDDEHISSILFRLFNIIDNIDAGGKPLSYIYGSKRPLLSTKCWLIVLEVYGSHCVTEETTSYRTNSINLLTNAVDELEYICQDSEFLTSPAVVQICRDISNLQHCLKMTLEYLEQHVPGAQRENEEIRAGNYAKAGHLLPLTCGHSGPLNEQEKEAYRQHLIAAGFVIS
jgi:hypothetical protein